MTVTINTGDYGTFGAVVETLPAGFSYVSVSDADIRVTETGQEVRFTLFGETSFTYNVTASSTAGSYTFSGYLRPEEGTDQQIADSTIMVEAAAGASATRSLSETTVSPGDWVTVSITADDYGRFGAVVETLPAGFSYVSVSTTDIKVTETGQEVRFTLFDETSFTYSYTVTASSTAGNYTFSGYLKDDTGMDHRLDDSPITVEVPVGGTEAIRSLSRTSVALGGTVIVSITANDYGELWCGGGDTAGRVQLCERVRVLVFALLKLARRSSSSCSVKLASRTP